MHLQIPYPHTAGDRVLIRKKLPALTLACPSSLRAPSGQASERPVHMCHRNYLLSIEFLAIGMDFIATIIMYASTALGLSAVCSWALRKQDLRAWAPFLTKDS